MKKTQRFPADGQRVVLDRFEENLAVLTGENGVDISAARSELPIDAAPGDTLVWRQGRWQADADDTQARRLRIAEKRRRLFRKNGGEG